MGSDPFLLVLLVGAGSVADVAAVLYAVWIVMGPVHEATKIIPFVHAAHVYTITHAERHALGQVNIVRYQQAAPISDVDDESLVSGTVIIVRQKASHEASNLNPATIVAFLIGFVHPMPCCLFWAVAQNATKKAASPSWPAV